MWRVERMKSEPTKRETVKMDRTRAGRVGQVVERLLS
jgi:hypothetical protein